MTARQDCISTLQLYNITTFQQHFLVPSCCHFDIFYLRPIIFAKNVPLSKIAVRLKNMTQELQPINPELEPINQELELEPMNLQTINP